MSLLEPAKAVATAPDKFSVKLETTNGDVIVDVERALAPRGADRFYNLVTAGFYQDVAFYRIVPGFVAQVGLHGDPAVNRVWRDARIQDDPVRAKNDKGTLSYATSGPNARSTQIFINLRNNAQLDSMGFSPFARVRSLDVVEQLYSGYGEGAPNGKGPQQSRVVKEGNAYLKSEFPKLDYIIRATLI